jgi:hypothetical protein
LGAPSSQAIADWVVDDLTGTEWERLDAICLRVVTIRLREWSSSAIADVVELNVGYVAEHLRDDLAACSLDGVPPVFEIDNEESPYIKLVDTLTLPLLQKLRSVDPFDFESVCSTILSRLGAQAEVTQKTNDGGVDFYAIDFDFVPDGIKTPQACRAAVIGQAKRYKNGNNIHETDLRAFIGGATKVKHDLTILGKILPLSPVVYAFWTTSDFDPNAKLFCRSLGLWYLSGRALARYVLELKLEPYIDSLLKK